MRLLLDGSLFLLMTTAELVETGKISFNWTRHTLKSIYYQTTVLMQHYSKLLYIFFLNVHLFLEFTGMETNGCSDDSGLLATIHNYGESPAKY